MRAARLSAPPGSTAAKCRNSAWGQVLHPAGLGACPCATAPAGRPAELRRGPVSRARRRRQTAVEPARRRPARLHLPRPDRTRPWRGAAARRFRGFFGCSTQQALHSSQDAGSRLVGRDLSARGRSSLPSTAPQPHWAIPRTTPSRPRRQQRLLQVAASPCAPVVAPSIAPHSCWLPRVAC